MSADTPCGSHIWIQDSLEFIKTFVFKMYSQEILEPLGITFKEKPERIIGTVGCFWTSKSSRGMELAYAISEDYWGQGLVPEAAQALIDYVVKEYSPKRIQARCKAENRASVRVMKKIGMTYEGTLKAAVFHRHRFWDLCYYAKVF